jgi:hypothetical protein
MVESILHRVGAAKRKKLTPKTLQLDVAHHGEPARNGTSGGA